MTDVAAVVAAAAGSRGIGFQGKLVSFATILHAMTIMTYDVLSMALVLIWRRDKLVVVSKYGVGAILAI